MQKRSRRGLNDRFQTGSPDGGSYMRTSTSQTTGRNQDGLRWGASHCRDPRCGTEQGSGPICVEGDKLTGRSQPVGIMGMMLDGERSPPGSRAPIPFAPAWHDSLRHWSAIDLSGEITFEIGRRGTVGSRAAEPKRLHAHAACRVWQDRDRFAGSLRAGAALTAYVAGQSSARMLLSRVIFTVCRPRPRQQIRPSPQSRRELAEFVSVSRMSKIVGPSRL